MLVHGQPFNVQSVRLVALKDVPPLQHMNTDSILTVRVSACDGRGAL